MNDLSNEQNKEQNKEEGLRNESDNFDFENRTDLTAVKNALADVKSEIQKVIVGQRELIDYLIVALLADGHALIEGVPGIAKTLSAKLLAKTIKTDFSRIQFTPDLMPSDVLGTSIFNFANSEFNFKKGPIFSNIVLIDEINRAPAKTQAALFEVMEEKQITFDGNKYLMEAPFMVLATQNPIEQEGTYRLPEAQLDRFLMKINVDYPSEMEEVEILKGFHTNNLKHNTDQINPVISPKQLMEFKELVATVRVEEKLMAYIAQLVNQTRNTKDLYLGASPRASLGLLSTAKAFAVLNGRDFITPEDIQYMAKPVLRHRIMLSPEREMEGLQADDVIDRLIQNIEVPR